MPSASTSGVEPTGHLRGAQKWVSLRWHKYLYAFVVRSCCCELPVTTDCQEPRTKNALFPLQRRALVSRNARRVKSCNRQHKIFVQNISVHRLLCSASCVPDKSGGQDVRGSAGLRDGLPCLPAMSGGEQETHLCPSGGRELLSTPLPYACWRACRQVCALAAGGWVRARKSLQEPSLPIGTL